MANISRPCNNGDRCTSLPLPMPSTNSPVNAPNIEIEIATVP